MNLGNDVLKNYVRLLLRRILLTNWQSECDDAEAKSHPPACIILRFYKRYCNRTMYPVFCMYPVLNPVF